MRFFGWWEEYVRGASIIIQFMFLLWSHVPSGVETQCLASIHNTNHNPYQDLYPVVKKTQRIAPLYNTNHNPCQVSCSVVKRRKALRLYKPRPIPYFAVKRRKLFFQNL